MYHSPKYNIQGISIYIIFKQNCENGVFVAFCKLCSSHSRVMYLGQNLGSLYIYIFVFRQDIECPQDPINLLSVLAFLVIYIRNKKCLGHHPLFPTQSPIVCHNSAIQFQNHLFTHLKRGNELAKISFSSVIS